jgi:hypothetical protein
LVLFNMASSGEKGGVLFISKPLFNMNWFWLSNSRVIQEVFYETLLDPPLPFLKRRNTHWIPLYQNALWIVWMKATLAKKLKMWKVYRWQTDKENLKSTYTVSHQIHRIFNTMMVTMETDRSTKCSIYIIGSENSHSPFAVFDQFNDSIFCDIR